MGDSLGADRDAAAWVSAEGYTWTRVGDETTFGGPGQDGTSAVVAAGPGVVAVGYDGVRVQEGVEWGSGLIHEP